MQKSNWICTDVDCAQFRREAPEKGSNVFELAQVNAYGDTYCVAHGFVYLDMDVEVLKPFNDLLNLKSAVCWQDEQDGFEAACFGAEKGSPWIKECLNYYKNRHFILPDGKLDLKPLPNIMEDTLRAKGYSIENIFSIGECLKKEKNNALMVLSNAFFSPKSYQTGIITKTEQTYSIHHFAASWVNKYDNLPLYAKMWKFLHLPDTNIRERFFKKKKQYITVQRFLYHKIFPFGNILTFATTKSIDFPVREYYI